MSINNSLLTIG